MESVPGRTPQWVSVDAEAAQHAALPTEVSGEIPKWLSGSLYRNGGGVYDIKDTHIRHFFDGFAVLHRFTILNGQVTYKSSLLDTTTLAQALGTKRIVPTESGLKKVADPCKTIFQGSQSYFAEIPAEFTDNTSVSVVELGDALYALTETATINKIDPDSLKRLEMIDLTKVISIHTGTAHPHFGTNGDMFSYGTSFDHRKAYNIVRIPAPQDKNEDTMMKAEVVSSIQSRWQTNISYNHSFGMSEKYFIVLDQPVAFNTKKFQISHVDMQGVAGTLVLRRGEPLQFNVIDRKTNKKLPVTYETNSSFVFHFVNCFEEEDYLVIDLILYHRIDAVMDLYMDSMRKTDYRIPDAGSFARFVLPLNVDNVPCDMNLVNLPHSKATAIKEYDAKTNTITLTPDFLMPEKVTVELPRINYKMVAGRKYRYAYGSSILHHTYRLVKVDTQERSIKEWKQTNYYLPGEPVFVPRPGAIEEDDGVILSPVLCETLEERSFLLILDAKSFTEIARAYIPRDVKMSFTFHGSFRPETPTNGEPEVVDIHL